MNLRRDANIRQMTIKVSFPTADFFDAVFRAAFSISA